MKKPDIFIFVHFKKIDFMEGGGNVFSWKEGGRPNKFEKHFYRWYNCESHIISQAIDGTTVRHILSHKL